MAASCLNELHGLVFTLLVDLVDDDRSSVSGEWLGDCPAGAGLPDTVTIDRNWDDCG
jgi:hypothetical protein